MTSRGALPVLADNDDFVSRMAVGWENRRIEPAVDAAAARSAAAHRAALSTEFPSHTLVIVSGTAMLRNDDCYFPFRPHSDFVWLAACAVEDAVLILTPAGGGHDATLFMPEPLGPGTKGAFVHRDRGDFWVGPMPALAEWEERLGLDVRPLSDATQALARAARTAPVLVAGAQAAAEVEGVPARSVELARAIAELRMIKDDWEVGQLRDAVDATVTGFVAVARELATAIDHGGERWLQGTFDRHARTYGNGTGYGTIIGSGPNAPVLHWTRCEGPVLPDELVLVDAGVETRSFYTADVTRTLPASGTFSPVQRQVHNLVQRAHESGLAAVNPGAVFNDFHYAAMEIIAQGLFDWGVLPVSVDEAVSVEGQHHRRYLACGIGHHLGLDVHDCSQARHQTYGGGALKPGMVLTVEPGLYFHPHDLTLPPELRGIGVRIEDDVLVTETGSEVLSASLPISAHGLEEWLKQSGAQPD